MRSLWPVFHQVRQGGPLPRAHPRDPLPGPPWPPAEPGCGREGPRRAPFSFARSLQAHGSAEAGNALGVVRGPGGGQAVRLAVG
eukprot:5226165-Alexandrium_andersonii.AAC.1